MSDTEPLDLDLVEARANAASDGPWRAISAGARNGGHYVVARGSGLALIAANDGENEDQRGLDAEFMAHAREDVPALIAEVRRLRDICDRALVAASGVDVARYEFDSPLIVEVERILEEGR